MLQHNAILSKQKVLENRFWSSYSEFQIQCQKLQTSIPVNIGTPNWWSRWTPAINVLQLQTITLILPCETNWKSSIFNQHYIILDFKKYAYHVININTWAILTVTRYHQRTIQLLHIKMTQLVKTS